MGQEFFIKSDTLESKVRSLLPSQGGLGQGFDLSASTQIIPIVDLTESAEGSNLRQDLQTSLSHASISTFSIENTTTTLINNTGYFRIYGAYSAVSDSGGTRTASFDITDGATSKQVIQYRAIVNSAKNNIVIPFDFIMFLEAGHTFTGSTSASNNFLVGSTRQIATIDGELVNP